MLDSITSALVTLVIMSGILYLTYVCSRRIGHSGRLRGRTHYMKMVDQLPVGQDRTLAIIQKGSTYLLLGITSSQITLLETSKELEKLDDGDEVVTQVPDFKVLLEKLGNRKKQANELK